MKNENDTLTTKPASSDADNKDFPRFDFNANTIEGAKNYMRNRAKQLLRFGYKMGDVTEFEWGISTLFSKGDEILQSLFILESYRGKGLYKKNVTHTILTSHECDIEKYLQDNGIKYVSEDLTPFREYDMIASVYGDHKAKRSNVYLMNHIDEGLAILEWIGASDIAKKAYCLHPIVQNDDDLIANYDFDFSSIDPKVMMAAMEYRSVANEYLSTRTIQSIKEIRLSPLKDVNDMLIADKIQNRKDFMLYHKGKHDRSDELEAYFDNWMRKLGVLRGVYNDYVKRCS